MKRLLASVALIAALSDPVLAQWQVDEFAVPLGRGTGKTGFAKALPGTSGWCLRSNGPAANPTFQACSTVTSVFGRTGAVVKQVGDYAVADVTGAAPTASPVFSGNIGLGVTPSAWSGIWQGVQINSVSFGNINSTIAATVGNAYFNSPNWRYVSSDFAAYVAMNNAGGVSWYTAPSGVAGNIATLTERMSLSNAGVFRLPTLGQGVANFDSSGNVSSKKAYTTAMIFPADFGVLGDGTTNNNTAVQNLLNACTTFSAFGNACRAEWPCGKVLISAGFSSTQGMKNVACGPGYARVLPLNTANVGGTVIIQSCTTCTSFQFTTLDPVSWQDIGFDAPLNATVGCILSIKGPAQVDGRERNSQSLISNAVFTGGYDQVCIDYAFNYSINNSVFRSPARDANRLLNSAPSLTESGDSSIYANAYWVLLKAAPDNFYPFGGDCIHVEPQSGLKIFGNKGLLCKNFIRIIATSNGGGVLQAFDNNLEEIGEAYLKMEQSAAGATFGQVMFSGNNTQNTVPTTFIGGVVILPGVAQYTNDIMIDNNNFNIQSGTAGTMCMFLLDGNNVKVTGNTCRMNGVATHGGIAVKFNATNVSLLDNRITGVGAGALQYDTTVPTLIRDPYGMTFAKYPANVAPGSSLYITDGKATNPGAANFALTNGGTGCTSQQTGGGAFCLP